MAGISAPNAAYWSEYGPFQRVKHDLIRCYLGGWFPKLALGYFGGRVLYVDTHAGRGRHGSGEPGSPLVALKTLLEHSSRDKLLAKSEFRFLFLERDPANLSELSKELEQFGELPDRVKVDKASGDAFSSLDELIKRFDSSRQTLAPSFVFVDPFGFKVPADLLRKLMAAGRVELFVNVIWRELDMAVQQRPEPGHGMADTLDSIFGGPDWRDEIDSDDVDERMNQAVRLLARKVGAKWWTFIRMVSGGKATRYLLVHFTNHDDGRDLMKDCIWKIIPDGGYYVLKSDDPNQPMLIEREPDLAPLETWLIAQLSDGPKSHGQLTAALRATIWRTPQLNDILRRVCKNASVKLEGAGKLVFSSDPVFSLA